ncbi:hypothetical protein WJX79_007798 [Trebouxia sp. C0005]
MWQASGLQATPYLAAALSKTDCRSCNQLQSKAVQSATDSSQTVLQCQSSTTMQAARKKHAAEFARYHSWALVGTSWDVIKKVGSGGNARPAHVSGRGTNGTLKGFEQICFEGIPDPLQKSDPGSFWGMVLGITQRLTGSGPNCHLPFIMAV